MNIKKLVDYPEARSVLIYGNSGTGKTTAAASSPGPILYIDAEAGLTGLSRGIKDVDFLNVTKVDDIRQAYLELTKDIKQNKYKTIVIDSLTEIVYKIQKEITGGKSGKQLTIGEWGQIISQAEELVRAYLDFPRLHGVNLVITALSQDKADDETLVKVPAMPGKDLPYKVMSLVDAVLYSFTRTTEGKQQYKLLTRGSDKISAKIRTEKVDLVIDQDMTKLFNILNQKEELANARHSN